MQVELVVRVEGDRGENQSRDSFSCFSFAIVRPALMQASTVTLLTLVFSATAINCR